MTSAITHRWRHIDDPQMGPTTTLSESFLATEADGTITLPNLRRGREIIVASDYSRDNPGHEFKTLTFLFVVAEDLPAWQAEIADVRRSNTDLGLSVPEYKDKNYGPKKRATPGWLNATAQLDGLLLSFASPLRALNWFSKDKPFNMARSDIAPWARWDRYTMVKALTAAHLIGSVTRGLTNQFQRITWITDRDSITQDHQGLSRLFRGVMRLYGARADRLVTCYTEETYENQQLAKDMLVISDLVSGTMATALKKRTVGRSPLKIQLDKVPIALDGFDRRIMWWLCQDDGALKSVNVEVTQGIDPDNFGFIIRGWGPDEERSQET